MIFSPSSEIHGKQARLLTGPSPFTFSRISKAISPRHGFLQYEHSIGAPIRMALEGFQPESRFPSA